MAILHPNLKTFVAASTISVASLGVAPNVFADRIKPTPGARNLERFAHSLPSTQLSYEQQSAIEDSLDRAKAIVRDDETRRLFDQFSQEWIRDTEMFSDIHSHLLHPAYHKLLALGTSILPFIFDDMVQGNGARWLPALDSITLGKVNPVPPEHMDDAILMCQDWVKWAKSHGLTSAA